MLLKLSTLSEYKKVVTVFTKIKGEWQAKTVDGL